MVHNLDPPAPPMLQRRARDFFPPEPGEAAEVQAEITVEQLMRVDVPSVSPDASLSLVEFFVLEESCSTVPVTDAVGKLVGVITASDLVRQHFDDLGPTAREVMTDHFPRAQRDWPVARALRLMCDEEIVGLPVVSEHGELVGLLEWAIAVAVWLEGSSSGVGQGQGGAG